ncbi:MAG: chorismate mutase [Candidatus Marinimicrobia bacterium]|nr:chorismate mutase [Candidatus Neomarinimicrobiota bacterium]
MQIISRKVSFQAILIYMTDRIAEHRDKIDELDARILELIQKRVAETINIRRLKLEAELPLFTPDREQELIQRLIEESAGRLPASVIKQIWETIIQGGKQIKDDR